MNQKRKRIILFAALFVLILSVSSFVLAQTEIFLPFAQLGIVKTIFLPLAALLTDIASEPPPAPDPELHTKIEKIFDTPGYAEARITLTALNAKNNSLQFGLEGRSSESLAIDSDSMQTEKIYGYGGTNFVAQIVDSQGNILSSINTVLPPPSASPTPSGVAAVSAAATVGWTALTTGVTYQLESIYFPTVSIGYVVGCGAGCATPGTILKTTNGGTSWTEQTSGTDNPLNSVHFPADVNTGYAVGNSGTILKTTDGGTTWTSQTSGTANNLNEVFFIDNNTGYIGGGGGTILKTANGGTAWTSQTSGTGAALLSIFCLTSDTCYAVGETSGSPAYGTVLKTTNGGTTWTSQTSGVEETLYSVHFVDADTGYAVGSNTGGSGTIIKTTNGGTTWTSQTSGVNQTLLSVRCPADANTCWAVGSGIPSTIRKTTNGGTTWSSQTSSGSGALSSVFFFDNSTGFVAGVSGQIFKTTDGGGD